MRIEPLRICVFHAVFYIGLKEVMTERSLLSPHV